VELEALAVAHNTRAAMLPPEAPGLPARIAEQELQRAGAAALEGTIFSLLPRYEAFLSREIDRGLVRYGRFQATRRDKEAAVDGELSEPGLEHRCALPGPGAA